MEYYCEACETQFIDKHNYDRHLNRITHIKNVAISLKNMHCSICNYSAKRRMHFNTHLKTQKHIKAEIEYMNNISKYSCVKCNFAANSKSEYLSHINTRRHKEDENADIKKETISNTEIYMELIKDNAQFQKSMIEFCMKQNTEMQNTMMELCKINNTIQNCSHNNNNNTNSNNTQNFNINIFLNETCKNAMNINDFIETLQIDSESIERLGRDGYLEGMTKIFVDGLRQIKVQERPIHCTDVKRETFYIRDANTWHKDTDNKHIDTAINRVMRKNQANLHLWREENPRWDVMHTHEYEFYMKIMQECIGGTPDKERMNNRKLIRNLANFTSVKKTFPQIHMTNNQNNADDENDNDSIM